MNDIVLTVLALTLFFIVSLKRLDFSLGLIIIFLPSYLVRFKIGFLPLTLLEIMILIMTAVWFVKVLLKKEKINFGGFFWVGVFFLLSGIIAVFVSPDTEAALGIYKAYFIEAILFFVVLINVIREAKGLRVIIFSLGIGALLVAFFTIWQYFGILPGLEPYISESPKRVTSLFEFPTAVGKYLGPVFVFFMALIFVKTLNTCSQALSHNIFLWGVSFFSALGILFSVTRGAILGVFLAFIFISFFSRYRKIIWLSLFIILIIFLAMPWGRNQISNIVSGTDISADVHIVMWQGTVRMLRALPVTGAGLAGFPEVYNQYRNPEHVELFPYPDNFVLAVWSELGLAGLVVFIWLIYKYFLESIRLLRKKLFPLAYQVVVGLIAVMIYTLGHGLVDTPYFKNDLSIMFWLFIGLLVIIKNIGIEDRALQKEKNSV